MKGFTCAEPELRYKPDHLAVGRFFRFSNGLMKAITDDISTATIKEIVQSIGSPLSRHYYVQEHAWTNVIFMVLLSSLVLTSLLISLSYAYRLLVGWSRRRRRSRQRPQTLLVGFLILISGAIVTVMCTICFWNGLIGIQRQHYESHIGVDADFLRKYSEALACVSNHVEILALKKMKSTHVSSSRKLENVSEIFSALWSSEAALEEFLELTKECNQPQVEALRKRFGSHRHNNHSNEIDSGEHTIENTIKRGIRMYHARTVAAISQVSNATNKHEEEIFTFIKANTPSSTLRVAFLLMLGLPAALFVMCTSGVIILSVYTIMEKTREGPPNRYLNNIFCVLLRTYGYVGMIVSSLFFLVTAILLLTGFSPNFVCSVILEEHHRVTNPFWVHVTVGNVTANVNVKEAVDKCRNDANIYEAMSLRRFLPGNSASRHPSSATEQKDAILKEMEEISKAIVDRSEELSAASNLSSLASDPCISDNSNEFSDNIEDIQQHVSLMEEIHRKFNKSRHRIEKTHHKKTASSDEVFKFLNEALHKHSIKCEELAFAMSASYNFCSYKPHHFQGLWLASGLTAVVSIHIYGVMFDGSDMVKPKKSSASQNAKAKNSADAASGLKQMAYNADEKPARAPNDVYTQPPNAHSPYDDAAEMYKEDRWSTY